jgi:hypothetical protein
MHSPDEGDDLMGGGKAARAPVLPLSGAMHLESGRAVHEPHALPQKPTHVHQSGLNNVGGSGSRVSGPHDKPSGILSRLTAASTSSHGQAKPLQQRLQSTVMPVASSGFLAKGFRITERLTSASAQLDDRVGGSFVKGGGGPRAGGADVAELDCGEGPGGGFRGRGQALRNPPALVSSGGPDVKPGERSKLQVTKRTSVSKHPEYLPNPQRSGDDRAQRTDVAEGSGAGEEEAVLAAREARFKRSGAVAARPAKRRASPPVLEVSADKAQRTMCHA